MKEINTLKECSQIKVKLVDRPTDLCDGKFARIWVNCDMLLLGEAIARDISSFAINYSIQTTKVDSNRWPVVLEPYYHIIIQIKKGLEYSVARPNM